MAAEIKIHRGDQIGGCITEIYTKTTRILIDFGEDLPGSSYSERFHMDWGASADGKKPAVRGVFFTHYHGDHIGRFTEVPEHVQLCMSPLAREVLTNIHDALWDRARKLFDRYRREEDQQEMEREEAIRSLLQNVDRVRVFGRGSGRVMQQMTVGDIAVTPCQVDHSASEACMFLIQAGGRTILHTGDFRGHGLAGEGGGAMLEDVRALALRTPIHTLIIEGTMMSRSGEAAYSEADLRKTADRLFREHRHVFLLVSFANLDSIATFYQAAKAQGIPMYCHSSYTAAQLQTLGRYAREYLGIEGLEDITKFSEISGGERRRPFLTLINAYCYPLVRQCRECRPVVVYSMWEGYVTRQPGQGRSEAYHTFVRRCQAEGVQVIPPMDGSKSPYPPMHTSGHASPELIAKVICEAAPGEIRPIHTENAGGFFELDIGDLKQRINISGYRWVEDHRALSARSLQKFLGERDGAEKGSHRAFLELVKDRHPNELAFCLRGNSGGQAGIYYRNHLVFRIMSKGKIEFDFGHARCLKQEDRLKRKKELDEFGFQFEAGQQAGIVSLPAEKAAGRDVDELDRLYGCIKPMIDTFSEKKGLAEKSVQQQLFLAPDFKRLKEGYFIYDLEFSQPHAKALGCKNQPDMLAVRFDRAGKPERLAFVEVKSRPEALSGDSGLERHIRGMERYPDWLLPIRGRDACRILNQYIEVGLLEGRSEYFEEKDFARLPKEILLIFTGEDTLAALEPWKRSHGKLLEHYRRMPGGCCQCPDAGPMELYRREC